VPKADDFLESFSRRLDVEPPDSATVELLLAVAGVAAHSSERTAAPIAAFLVGRAGLAPADALVHAEAVAAELAGTSASDEEGR
jgi:hypothetical protein